MLFGTKVLKFWTTCCKHNVLDNDTFDKYSRHQDLCSVNPDDIWSLKLVCKWNMGNLIPYDSRNYHFSYIHVFCIPCNFATNVCWMTAVCSTITLMEGPMRRRANNNHPYPEPVYTGWSSVHWNATGMPLVDPVYTGIPLCHPANTCRVHWNTTGKN